MNNGLFLSVKTGKNHISKKKPGSRQRTIISFLELALCILLMAAAVLLFVRIGGISCYLLPVLGFGALVCLLFWLEWRKRETLYVILASVFGLFLFGFLIGNDYAVNGLLVCINQIADTIGRSDLTIFEKFQVTAAESAYPLYATFTLFFGAGLAAAVSAFTVFEGKYFFINLFALAIGFFAVWHRLDMGIPEAALCFFAVFAVSFYTASRRTKLSIVLPFALTLLLMFGAVLLAEHAARPALSEASPYERVLRAKQYQKNSAEGWNQGVIAGRKPATGGGTAFYIRMSHPQMMYLKGFVGAAFDGEKWQALDNQAVYDNRELFYRFEQNAFSPLYQSARLSEISRAQTEETAADTVEITLAGSGDQYMLLPYGTALLDKPEEVLSRADALQRQPKQAQAYTFSVGGLSYTELLDFEETIIPTLSGEAYDQYLLAEGNYGVYVNETYRNVPESEKEALQALLKKYQLNAADLKDYRTAIQKVQEVLNSELAYDPDETLPRFNGSVAETLLQQEKRGRDIHFATLATLLFRMLGYPARYVEGYLITPANALQMKSDTSTPFGPRAAHAWTELYLDRVGWMPVEVLPSFENMMFPAQTAENNPHPEVNSAQNAGEAENAGGTAYPNQGATAADLRGRILRCVLLIAVVFTLAVAAIFVRRGRIIRKRKGKMEGEDKKAAVLAAYDYLCSVLRTCRLLCSGQNPEEVFSKYRQLLDEGQQAELQQLLQICEKNAFSNEAGTGEEAAFVCETAKKHIAFVTEKQKILRNIWIYLYIGVG